MTIRHLVFGCLSAFFLVVWSSSPTLAQDPAGQIVQNIAVIDMDRLRRDSLAVKDIRSQIEGYRNSFRDEIQLEEEALREANKELTRQRSILSPEAFAEERKKFETRLADVQRRVQELRRDLDASQSVAMGQVQQSLNKIIGEIANEQSLTLVFRRDQTVLVATNLDITGIVLDRFNKAVPSVVVPKPGTAQ